MMAMQLDLTKQLATIPYGLALALAVSFIGILADVSRNEMRMSRTFLRDACRRGREVLVRRHLRVAPPLANAGTAR